LFDLLISGPRVRVPEGAPFIDILALECRFFHPFLPQNEVKTGNKFLRLFVKCCGGEILKFGSLSNVVVGRF
jgi:hypothetical protein